MTGKARPFDSVMILDSVELFTSTYGDKISLAEVQTISTRLSALLRSHGARFRLCKIVCIAFKNSGPEGIETISNTEKSLKWVDYSLPASSVFESEDVEALFIKLMCSILRTIAGAASTAVIDKCETLMLIQRNRVKILYKREEKKNYIVEVYISMLEPFPVFRQVYLRLIDKITKRDGQRLIAELHETDFYYLVDRIKVSKGLITVMPRKAPKTDEVACRYRARGFCLPLTITIDKIFDDAARKQ